MVISMLVALALPATAAAIYVIYRPLWAHEGLADAPVAATYKAIATRIALPSVDTQNRPLVDTAKPAIN